jgi:[ribosomal protein S5]-alanine N-acetyltransferase
MALTGFALMNRSAAVPVISPRIDWRDALPTLSGAMITLRELRPDDAKDLLASLGTAEVTRLISPPPPTVDGFEQFIAWTNRQRQAGKSIAYGVTLNGFDTVIGLFQIRSLTASFDMAEWGFALASDVWGTGIFSDAARAVLDFGFDVLGVRRMEAKAAVRNGRGNGALQKLGAVQEAVLRRSFLRNGVYLDQACWTILAGTWRELRAIRTARVIH